MKLHNIVILTTFNADMFQGYQILFFKALVDDIIVVELNFLIVFPHTIYFSYPVILIFSRF